MSEDKAKPKRSNKKKAPPSARPNVRRKAAKKNQAAPRASLRVRASTALLEFFDEKSDLLRRLGAFLAVVAVTAAVVWAGREVVIFAKSASAFAITEVTVDGSHWLDSLEIQRTAGTLRGSNIFEVSPEDAQERLANHPWIKSATVSRVLPHKVHITVVEHSPVAVLVLEELYLIGEDGNLFREVGVDDPVDLPFITGVDRTRFVHDSGYRAATVQTSVALLHDYRAAGLWKREPISEIHFDALGELALFIGSDATHIRLGRAPYRPKLRKLRTLLERLEQQHDRPAYVYLDNVRRPDRVTTRLR